MNGRLSAFEMKCVILDVMLARAELGPSDGYARAKLTSVLDTLVAASVSDVTVEPAERVAA